MRELHYDAQGPAWRSQGNARSSRSTRWRAAISGTPLRDSYHLGSTIINDYGRPYRERLQQLLRRQRLCVGRPVHCSMCAASFRVRRRLPATPPRWPRRSARDGRHDLSPPSLPTELRVLPTPGHHPHGTDRIHTDGRFLEAYVSAQVLNHVISFGKQDEWLGPGQGGGMAYSNNAENIYSFHINRIEPLHIPLLSRLTGPFRYEFLVGAPGHTTCQSGVYRRPIDYRT